MENQNSPLLVTAVSPNFIQDIKALNSFRIEFEQLSLSEMKEVLNEGFESAVGHESTANDLTEIFGFLVPAVRKTLKLGIGNEVYLVQTVGERLAEGATELSKEHKFAYFKVTFTA